MSFETKYKVVTRISLLLKFSFVGFITHGRRGCGGIIERDSVPRWQGNYTACSELFKMTKTDDGFCCAFNTISVQSSYASESGEEYDPSEYEDDDYDYYEEDYDDEDYDDEDYDDEDYDDSETTTSTTEAVTYAGSINNNFSFVYEQKFRRDYNRGNNNRGKHGIKFI